MHQILDNHNNIYKIKLRELQWSNTEHIFTSEYLQYSVRF